MDDLISRQTAIEALKEHRELYCDNTPDAFSKLSYAEKSRVDELDTAIAMLVDLPSAQLERKIGKWINKEVLNGCMFQSAKCSACGCYHTTPYVLNHFTKYNYCPSCGARMDEEEMQDATL